MARVRRRSIIDDRSALQRSPSRCRQSRRTGRMHVRAVPKCVPAQGRNGQQQNGDEAERAKIHWMVNRLIIVGT